MACVCECVRAYVCVPAEKEAGLTVMPSVPEPPCLPDISNQQHNTHTTYTHTFTEEYNYTSNTMSMQLELVTSATLKDIEEKWGEKK